MIKVLIVDESAMMRQALVQIFAVEREFMTMTARSGGEALKSIRDVQPDVVMLDIEMRSMDGLACLHRIQAEWPSPVVIVGPPTAIAAEATLRALQFGAVDFISKPEGGLMPAMDTFAPLVRDKVRAAASARLRGATRLADHLRSRFIGAAGPTPAPPVPAIARKVPPIGASPAGIVLIGCSTGGPLALETLLSRLPAAFPWPIIIAQHMPAGFTGLFARRLDRLCALAVSEVTAGQPLVPGRVVIGRGDADVVVAAQGGGLVALPSPPSSHHPWRPSVTRLVESAMAAVAADRLIGILMTGMGNDGAAAMARLRADGGRTIAEAEETAAVWGMPGELVRAGGATVVAPLDAIAARLLAMLP